MAKKTFIYQLMIYANEKNLKEDRYETEHVFTVKYEQESLMIYLSETNSLVDESYSLNLESAQFVVEGDMNESKEIMIHHHDGKHSWKHLQFKLSAENKEIRIKLDTLDQEDYERCIRGFLAIGCTIIEIERERLKVKENLRDYFFNEKISTLEGDRLYLVSKVKEAYRNGNILDLQDKSITELEGLRYTAYLHPFLDWKEDLE